MWGRTSKTRQSLAKNQVANETQAEDAAAVALDGLDTNISKKRKIEQTISISDKKVDEKESEDSKIIDDFLNESLTAVNIDTESPLPDDQAKTASVSVTAMRHPAFAKTKEGNAKTNGRTVKISNLILGDEDICVNAVVEGMYVHNFQAPKDQGDAKTGQLLNLTLSDDTGKVKAVCYRDQIARLSQIVRIGETFVFRKPRINRTKYSIPHGVDVELQLNEATVIEPSEKQIVPFQGKTVKTSDLVSDHVKDSEFVNIYGVVMDAGDLITKERVGSRPNSYRTLSIIDDSSAATIQCVLWGSHATDDKKNLIYKVVSLKNVKINVYKKVVNLSLYQVGELITSPEGERVDELKEFVRQNLEESDEEPDKV